MSPIHSPRPVTVRFSANTTASVSKTEQSPLPSAGSPNVSQNISILEGIPPKSLTKPLNLIIRPLAKLIGLLLHPFIGVKAFRIKQYETPIRNLPQDLNGLKVLQITDLHYYEHTRPEYISKVLENIRTLKPDILVFTGDLVHVGAEFVNPVKRRFLDYLPKDIPKIACLGNHDYGYTPKNYPVNTQKAVRQALENAGFKVLVNEAYPLQIRDKTLWISGMDDPSCGQPEVNTTLNQVKADGPHICLSHDPALADKISAHHHAPSLILSGHTHGGQLQTSFLAPLREKIIGKMKYLAGWFHSKGSWLYVNQGTGSAFLLANNKWFDFSLPEVRIGTTPEMSLFRLSADTVLQTPKSIASDIKIRL